MGVRGHMSMAQRRGPGTGRGPYGMRWPVCPGCCARREHVYEPARGFAGGVPGSLGGEAVRDGTVLRVNVVLPAGGGRFPVLMSAHPYGKDNLPARPWPPLAGVRSVPDPAADQPGAVPRDRGGRPRTRPGGQPEGYAVVNCDLRGAGTSGGEASCCRTRKPKMSMT